MLLLLDLYMIQLQLPPFLTFLMVPTRTIELLDYIDLVNITRNNEGLSTDLGKPIKEGQRYADLLLILRSLDELVK
jgi:hypothetical protein